MGEDHLRARDSDRNEAVEVIETAWSDGQITREEYDARVGRALSARTLGELEALVRDLQAPGSARVRATMRRLVPTRSDARPAPAGRTPGPRPALPARIGITAAVAMVGAGFVLPRLFAGTDDAVGTDAAAAPVDLLSTDGFRTFVEAVEAETGDTAVFDASLGDESYGSVLVPAGTSGTRAVEWTWREAGFVDERGTSVADDEQRLDLRRIDPEALPGLVEQAEALVEEPDYVVLTIGVDEDDPRSRACYRVMASNRFSESGTVTATCAGRVVDVDPPD